MSPLRDSGAGSFAELVSWMTDRIARRTGILAADIRPDDRFAELGLSSRVAVGLLGEVQDRLGRDLSPALLWEYPSIEDLCRHLVPEPPQPRVAVGAHRQEESPRSSVPDEQPPEGIAVIGLGCRFPGADGPDAFWRLLSSGTDAVTDARPDPPAGLVPLGRQGHLSGVDRFDAEFFGINPHEARRMDPQQRILLEVAWQALEDAGIAPGLLKGTSAGVFVGISNADYGRLTPAGPTAANTYSGTGQALSIAANRISYALDLRGPSIAVDTACSSSLVAVDQACRALRDGEAELALAGGVNLVLDGFATEIFSQAGMLAADGRCKTFDSSADGYVRAEGCGVVVLKQLAAARRDGDRVLAVVRGTAVNQDGRSNGLTAPNGLAQQDVVATALARAGVHPSEVGYVEAHGTGTPLGDPIELRALSAALGEDRTDDSRCLVGSVKTNIGHAESAAGIAGLIKAVLVLRHGVVPPHLHLHQLNPRIELPAWMSVPTAAVPWPAGDRRRVVGVSSFGFGGTNAHVVISDPPPGPSERPGAAVPPRPVQILTLSARTPSALRRLARSHADALSGQTGTGGTADICHTANTGRDLHAWRAALVADNVTALRESAEALSAGGTHPGVITGNGDPTTGGVAFLFTGQGSQYAGMSRGLHSAEPVFRDALEESAAHADPLLERPLLEVLFAEEDGARLLDRTEYAQPALFAVEYALACLWRSWGVEPAALLGHSVGELVAACVAGVMDPADGIRLAAARGRLMQRLPEGGGMLAVLAGEDEVLRAIGDAPLDIAAVNSRTDTVVSGHHAALRALADRLEQHGVLSRPLRTSHAFHSRLMEPAAAELAQEAAGIAYREPAIPLVSDLDGEMFTGTRLPDAGYWERHVRQPIKFADALRTLTGLGCHTFVEIGPGRTLTGLVRAESPGSTVVSSLNRDTGDQTHVLTGLARLHVAGVRVDWTSFEKGLHVRKTALPTYPFEGDRYWHPTVTAEQPAPAAAPAAVPDTRPAGAEAVVRELLLDLLGLEPGELSLDRPFVELGADSIMLIHALQKIRSTYQVDIPVSRFFENLDTVRKLVAHIEEHAPPQALAAALPEDPAVPPAPHSLLLVEPQVSSGAEGAGPAERSLAQLLDVHNNVMTQAMALLRGDGPAPVGLAERAAPAPAEPPDARTARSDDTYVAFHTGPPTTSSRLRPVQQDFLRAAVTRHEQRTARSREHARRERGVHADIRHVLNVPDSLRGTRYPLTVVGSSGSRLRDADGNEYIDLTMGFGVNFFGHGESFVNEAVSAQLAEGMQLGPQSPLAVELAELICEMTGAERAVFCNTGSEAVMTAVRLARAATGRSRIALFAGSYHGSSDPILVRSAVSGPLGEATPLAPGITEGIGRDTLVLPYGSPAALRVLREHAHELAGVLVEPVQSRKPDLIPREFLHDLRELLTEMDVPLIVDEVITGFRMHPGGAQALLGVRGDIATYGKVVGGGLPIGVVAGSRRYIDAVDGGAWQFDDSTDVESTRTFFSGTFCKHPLSLAAGLAVLRRMREAGPDLQSGLNARTAELTSRLEAAAARHGAPMRVMTFGSLFRFHFTTEAPLGSELVELFYLLLGEQGIYLWEGRNCFLSTAHTDADCDAIEAAVDAVLTAMAGTGFFMDLPGVPEGADTETATVPRPLPTATGDRQLSDVQREIWFLDQLGAEYSLAYTEMIAVDFTGELNRDALSRALIALMDRHESLRSVLLPDGSGRRILPADRFPLHHADLTEGDGDSPEERAEAWMADAAATPFELFQGPLVRMTLLRLGPSRHRLVLGAHHAVVDGWSFSVLLPDLAELYRSQLTGAAPSLPPAVPYDDHVAALAGDTASRDADDAYWRRRLADGIPAVELPADRPRGPRVTHRGASLSFSLDRDTHTRLRKAAAARSVTPFTLMLGAFAGLLHRITGQDDLVVGVPVALRTHPGGERVVGNCANVVPIRSGTSPDHTVADFVDGTRRSLLEGQDHVRFRASSLARGDGAGRGQLLRVLFNLDQEMAAPAFPDLTATVVVPDRRYVKCDLFADIRASRTGLHITFEYNSELYDETTVRGFATAYRSVLDAFTDDPAVRLSAIPLVGPAEQESLSRLGRGAVLPGSDLSVVDLFERQAAETPQAEALVDGDTRIRYGELNRAANRLAHHLLSHGVGPEVRVGLAVERSARLVTAVLAVLKAGGAYVPVDVAGPPERGRRILADAGIAVLITDGGPDRTEGTGSGTTVVDLVRDRAEVEERPDHDPAVDILPDSLCYVLFTSGSTGRPKGVMVTHRGLANAYAGWDAAYGLRADGIRSHLQMANVTFDVFAGDLVRALLSGGRLVLCPKETLLRPDKLLELLERESAECAEFVPVVVRGLLAHVEDQGRDLSFMRRIVLGSDTVTSEELDVLARVAGPGSVVVNSYGLTEATIDSTYVSYLPGDEKQWSGSVIGAPFGNVAVHILDSGLRPVPPGVVGTLYVAGDGVARGYLSAPGLTAELYVPDPWADVPGARMFDTGDLARFRWDGDRAVVEFIGRQDGQVKIRGNRVETGEVEAVVTGLPGVRAAAVAVDRSGGEPRLVAGLVLEPGSPGDPETGPEGWYHRLRSALPIPMIPDLFLALPALPVTANGKVDRTALLRTPGEEIVLSGGAEAPRTPLEAELAEIWSEALGAGPRSVHDEFFAVGGNSLTVIRMLSQVNSRYGADVAIGDFFGRPTLAALAESIEKQRTGTIAPPHDLAPPAPEGGAHATVRADGTVLLSSAQSRFWFLEQLWSGTPLYTVSSAAHISGPLDTDALIWSIGRLVARHEVLRSHYPVTVKGPGLRVREELEVSVPVVDLTGLTEAECAAEAERLTADHAYRPFDLEKGPVLRVSVLRIAPARFRMLFTIHHIAADFWSVRILLHELMELYAARTEGRPEALPPLMTRFADAAIRLDTWLESGTAQAQLAYWKDRLEGIPARRSLTPDRLPEEHWSAEAGVATIRLGEELGERIAALASRRGATTHMVLVTALKAVLAVSGAGDDVVVGTPAAQRLDSGLQGLVGPFINTLALRTDLGGDLTLAEAFERVGSVCRAAYNHQDVPFDKVVEAVGAGRGRGNHPLFTVMFQYLPDNLEHARTGDVEITFDEVKTRFVEFDLLFEAAGTPRGIEAVIRYKAVLYDSATIDTLLRRWQAVLVEMTESPDLLLSRSSRTRTAAELPAVAPAMRNPVLGAPEAARDPKGNQHVR
ncbi:amino acid adenylation domain-containing protein [Streptomyces sp. NPDC026589]|uniref:non-ribosomal peptide synthetase/type I polyketide synthase n=1 Tax=Streptomyces sp. NPDC026589 TaxID=3155609 RepID=UPI0033CBD004